MTQKRILCPIDFSIGSQVALHEASRRALDWNAKLYIVHVESVRQSARPGSAAYVKELDEHRRLLQEGKPDDDNIDFEQHYLRGNVADEIVRFADARDIDCIILGTHGRTGIRRVLMGEVADNVSRLAKCEVVAVPHEDAPLSAARPDGDPSDTRPTSH